jgi:hypothetical protein
MPAMTSESPTVATAAPPSATLGRGFAAQLTSTGLANLGDGILGTMAPLVALSLTSSPLQISLLSAAAWLPWLVLGLVAGVVVDRSWHSPSALACSPSVPSSAPPGT